MGSATRVASLNPVLLTGEPQDIPIVFDRDFLPGRLIVPAYIGEGVTILRVDDVECNLPASVFSELVPRLPPALFPDAEPWKAGTPRSVRVQGPKDRRFTGALFGLGPEGQECAYVPGGRLIRRAMTTRLGEGRSTLTWKEEGRRFQVRNLIASLARPRETEVGVRQVYVDGEPCFAPKLMPLPFDLFSVGAPDFGFSMGTLFAVDVEMSAPATMTWAIEGLLLPKEGV